MGFGKKLTGDAMLYGMSSIIGRLLNWLLVPLYTRVFVNQDLLTENAQLYVWMVPLMIIYTFGMETAFFRFGSREENRSEVFNLIGTFLLIFNLVLTTILILFSKQYIAGLGFPGHGYLIILLAVILMVDSYSALAFVKLRAEGRAQKFVTIKLVNIFINVGLNLLYLVFFYSIAMGKTLPEYQSFIRSIFDQERAADYIIWANYVSSLLTLLLLWRSFSSFRFVWNWQKLKPMFNYAYPLMVMGLAGSINLTADRLMFRSLLPYGFYPEFPSQDTVFSIYAQVYKLSIFMTLVVQAYRYAADPLFFSKMGDKNTPSLIALSTKWFTIASIILWMAVSFNLDWIQLLIGESYRSAVYIVPLLLLANLFIGVYGNVSIWFKLSDNTEVGTCITIGTMLLTVVLNFFMIPKLGYLGSSLTFAISSFFMVVTCLYFGQKYYPIPYSFKNIILYLIGAGAMIFLVQKTPINNLAVSIVYHNFLLLLFIAIIYVVEIKGVKTS